MFSFSEVQCVDPLSVKDGFIEVSNFKGRYVFGSLATYHCNPGYILWGMLHDFAQKMENGQVPMIETYTQDFSFM